MNIVPNSKKPLIRNGVMQKLIVYENGAIVGYGHVIVLTDGRMSTPTLLDLLGNELPAGWYQLQITDEKHYVVVPKGIQ